jgi:hypothetical protein
MKSFSHLFRSYRHDVSEKARQYACGLMQAGSRKNTCRGFWTFQTARFEASKNHSRAAEGAGIGNCHDGDALYAG